VLRTGRAENAHSLGSIAHVITPNIALLPRERFEDRDVSEMLAERGFTFPLLLRASGFHTGRHFLRIENGQGLTDGVASMPGQELLAIQYVDTRRHDGKIRKYRVMMIGGVLYPLHAAISHEWKIHYFTAEMADNPEHRAEDAAFLTDMTHVLGPRAVQALETICRTLGLDYGGIDFSLNAEGEIVLFEANASMVVYAPDPDARWDYRRPAVQRILDAIRHLLTRDAPQMAARQ
jgi:glutathione synthase/RimK-type ligase-like ATP-grasp enzyme